MYYMARVMSRKNLELKRKPAPVVPGACDVPQAMWRSQVAKRGRPPKSARSASAYTLLCAVLNAIRKDNIQQENMSSFFKIESSFLSRDQILAL